MSEENKAPETPQAEGANLESTKSESTNSVEESAKADAPKAETTPKAEVAPKAETASKPDAPAKPAPAAKADAPAKPAATAAKPAAKPEAPPDPRVIAAGETAGRYKEKLVAQFGESAVEAAEAKKFLPTLVINREHWVQVVEYMKTEPSLAFTYAECMAGTDYKDYIEVFLYLHSFELDTDVALKVRTPRENASIPSVTGVHSGLNWEEREIFDLLGVDFPGHPDMKRIMLPDEWHGHPLRKDYVVQD